MFKVKSTPETKVFIHFTLRWTTLEIWTNFVESATNHPPKIVDMFKVKISICMLDKRPRLKFMHVLLYNHPFSSYAPFLRNVHQTIPHVRGQNYPRGNNFHPFWSTLNHFEIMNQFCEKYTEWPQNDQTYSRLKVPNIHRTHTSWGLNFHQFRSTMSLHRISPLILEKWTKCTPKWSWTLKGQS